MEFEIFKSEYTFLNEVMRNDISFFFLFGDIGVWIQGLEFATR
jgi:hypothetical protein